MKAIHFTLGLILFLSLAAAGLALIVSPAYPQYLQAAHDYCIGLPHGRG